MFQDKSHRIISLMMAFLMLCSSTGFSIDFHYCQGNLKHFSIFGEAESCHSKKANNHCKMKKNSSCKMKKKTCPASSSKEKIKDCKKGCCSNNTITIPTITDLQLNANPEYKLSPLQFVKAFVANFIIGHIDLSEYIAQHQYYIPPLLDRDIPILVQCFRL